MEQYSLILQTLTMRPWIIQCMVATLLMVTEKKATRIEKRTLDLHEFEKDY